LKNIAVFLSCSGMGDIISSIPTIRLLHKLYKKNILVFTHNTELLKNYPYIDVKNFNNNEIDKLSKDSNWLVFDTFNLSKDIHPRIDIRQFHANKIGVQLLPEEMNIKFYPNNYIPIENLPKNYIVIHPVKTWPSRTWEEHRWQKFVNIMETYNIPIIAVGKDSSEVGTYNIQKPTFDIKIKNGLNLMNKVSIHQTWHILNKSTVVITMDSGILHLAGMTDTSIIQLGSSIDPKFRAPYRNNSQNYKYKYISGDCKLLCASDMKYYIKYNGEFNTIPPIPFCLEKPESIGDQNLNSDIYKCHPSVGGVVDETIRMYNMYKSKEQKSTVQTNNKGKLL